MERTINSVINHPYFLRVDFEEFDNILGCMPRNRNDPARPLNVTLCLKKGKGLPPLFLQKLGKTFKG